MEKLSATIITLDEEANIGRCIDSLWQVADEIIVLDSNSSDKTGDIARQKGAIVKQRPFSGYIEQKNRALQLTSYNYVLSLDADEILSEGLVRSILKEKLRFGYCAYYMNRSNNYCGKFIRHGLWYPNHKVRLFDKRIGYWGGMNPHDAIKLPPGKRPQYLKGDIVHFAYNSVKEHLLRNEELSTIAAYSLYEAGIKRHWTKIVLSPSWSFIHGYFLRQGILDGYYGFIIARLTAQQSFLKYQKLRRLVKQKQNEVELVMNNLTN
jgi:glycosyltransferase involved in cell wall biosynthesis